MYDAHMPKQHAFTHALSIQEDPCIRHLLVTMLLKVELVL